MDNHLHLVIMAGGIGSRFWPMSTPECPKQFIDVLGCGRTLLQLTFDRFKDICPPQNVWIVTSAAYDELVRQQLPRSIVALILMTYLQYGYLLDIEPLKYFLPLLLLS